MDIKSCLINNRERLPTVILMIYLFQVTLVVTLCKITGLQFLSFNPGTTILIHNNAEFFQQVLIQNTVVLLVVLSGNIFGLMVPLINLVINSTILGVTLGCMEQTGVAFLLMIPHGIIEVMAFICCFLSVISHRVFKEDFQAYRLVVVSYFLLLVGAFFETFVSPTILSNFI